MIHRMYIVFKGLLRLTVKRNLSSKSYKTIRLFNQHFKLALFLAVCNCLKPKIPSQACKNI